MEPNAEVETSNTMTSATNKEFTMPDQYKKYLRPKKIDYSKMKTRLGVGVAIGVAVGAAIDNTSTGIAVGIIIAVSIVIGAGFGTTMGSVSRHSKKK